MQLGLNELLPLPLPVTRRSPLICDLIDEVARR